MLQEAKEGSPTKAERETAWDAGFSDATDGKPKREDWPDDGTAGDYDAGHQDGRHAVAQNVRAEEHDEADEMAHIRGCFATLERKTLKRCEEIAERARTDAGGAALDIAETVAVLCRELVAAIDRGEGPEAIVAAHDTLRQVKPIAAAETTNLIPPGRDATRRGLARLIGKKRAQLARMDSKIPQRIPPAFLDADGGDLWDAHTNAETLTDPNAYGRRSVRRQLDALVHAWDVA
ncbi:MAG: hypothetical protein OXU74_06580 [Gemmatimonadota bacterium]|nr:hypothetical protein [Gemmatimonadota bacterium]